MATFGDLSSNKGLPPAFPPVDHVFPIVPVRQWVLSIPFALRYRLAYDSGLLSDTTYLNPEAFEMPPPGTLGGMGRASIQGPGTWELDAAVAKIFRIRERQDAEFRAETYNVTNSFRLDNPTTQLNSVVFGRINSSLPPRIMRFALKYM